MAAPRPRIDPELVVSSEEIREKLYGDELARLLRCEITPGSVECADLTYILHMTPGVTDVYIQEEMVGRYMYCCNRQTRETKCVLVQQSWLHSRLGEHLSCESGQHVTYLNDPFESAIPNDFKDELLDFKEISLKCMLEKYPKRESRGEPKKVPETRSQGRTRLEPGITPSAGARLGSSENRARLRRLQFQSQFGRSYCRLLVSERTAAATSSATTRLIVRSSTAITQYSR